VTEIETVPAIARSPEGIVATSWVAETYVLATRTEFALTVERGRKLDPVICTCVSAEPSGTVEGVMETIDGSRLLTENDAAEEDPPPGAGFVTTTEYEPAMARSPPANEIVSSLALM
jgi:hypothetical protein